MQVGPASASQGGDRSVSGGGGGLAESRDFEDERLLRLWPVAVADRAEDDDAVWAARQLLACNQHGHWSVAVRAAVAQTSGAVLEVQNRGTNYE